MSNQRISSFTHSCWKYDVFLSFRGEDTRKNFTDHLYNALKREGINIFRDDNELKRGKPISLELLQAIEQSRFSIIVFSKNYASSSWCLDELVKIVQCMEARDTILPVFYDVEPYVVRNQEGEYKEDFVYHERANKEKVQNWRNAMRKVANLAGWDVKDRHQFEVIQQLVKEIQSKLPLSTSMNYGDLVGINSRKKRLMELIEVESNDVRMIGIWGMGGIGKTTIAKVIYETKFGEFEFQKSFLANVRENFKNDGGVSLQRQLIYDILKKNNAWVPNSDEGIRLIKKELKSHKVLVIIDDVDDINQLKALAGEHSWFGTGSRIIITTRDEHLFKSHRVNEVYKVEVLNHADSFQLFSLKAFPKIPPSEKYVKLSKHFMKYANGVPLALEVLGSFLIDRSIEEWDSELDRLKKEPEPAIFNILQTSFDGLKESEQTIFLDVACFFKGKIAYPVIKMWKACGFNPTIGISILMEKCLLDKYSDYTLSMHDLLQEMGQQMVKKKSYKDLGKCSRLWEAAEIRDVLTKKRGTEAVEGIRLDMSKIKEIDLNPTAFAKMCNLRFFDFCCTNAPMEIKYDSYYKCSCNEENSKKVLASQPLEFAFSDLAYFRWHRYPLKALPSGFNPEKLVALVMPHSEVEELWDGIQPLGNLLHINLRHSKHLKKIPDLTEAPNLESLILEGCTRLIEIHSSIQNLNTLEIVNLSNCSSLKTSPMLPCNIRDLLLDGTAISKFHLPDDPSRLKFLSSLSLIGCKIRELPDSIGQLYSLKRLHLDKNNFEWIPATIKDLHRLYILSLSDCVKLQSLPALPRMGDLYVNMHNCVGLEELPDSSFLFSSTDWGYNTINLVNCFKLDVNAMGNKVKDRLPRVQRSASNGTGFSVCFPGNEVPEWFPNQNEGSSMIIELPPDWKNKNFLGFATCAVVEFSDVVNYEEFNIGCTCYRNKGKLWDLVVWNSVEWYTPHQTDLDIRQDHIFLGFNEAADYVFPVREEDGSNEAYIDFSVFNSDGNSWKESYGCKVKKCGFQLVYGQDSGKAMEEKEEEISNCENKCGLHPLNEKEAEEFNSSTNPSNNLTLLDLNEFPQDFAGPTMDIATTKRNLADWGAELRIGYCNEEPQSCCAPVTYDMQSNSFTLLDFVGSSMNVSTNKRSLADHDGAEPDRNGCDEDDPQPKRVKRI